MTRSRVRRAVGAAAVTLALGSFAGSTFAGSGLLPPAECVRLMREARIAERSGEVDRAFDLLSEASERFPREVLPVQELLRLHETKGLDRGRTGELRAQLLERLRDPGAHLGAGSLYFLVDTMPDDPELLRVVLDRIERRQDGDLGLELLKAKAVVQLRLGLDREARATLGRLIEAEPTFQALSQALRIDLDQRAFTEALELLERHRDDPELGAVFRDARLALLAKTGQVERVRAELESLREGQDPEALSSTAYRDLVKIVAWDLYDAGDRELTEWLWRRLLEESPGDREARLVLANLFATEDERVALTASVDRQLGEETEPETLLEVGTEYLASGDYARALDLLARAAQELPDNEAAWFNLGIAATHMESWQEAEQALRRAVSINPSRAASQSSLGLALVQLERCPEAIPALKAAIDLDPDRTVDYYYLAGCYRETGDMAAAAAARAEYDRRRGGG